MVTVPPLWTPDPERAASAHLSTFAHVTEVDGGYPALHRWSVEHPDAFWSAVWRHFGVVGDPGDVAVAPAEPFFRTRFFPDGRLNFAENLLRRRGDDAALVFTGEDDHRREVSWSELRHEVARVQQALRAAGVAPGDRVAAWLPNVPETYALMLGTASVGATFSSTSPDFGVSGVADRFAQIEPSVLVVADGYTYLGRRHERLSLLPELLASLPSVTKVVVVPFLDDDPPTDHVTWPEWLDQHPGGEPEFPRFPFDQPLYVLYSSGTTGAPKCIVHRAGGILLKHLVEHRLHCDVRDGDRVFYFTTAGWMMWNWLASGLASNATLVLYDGAPTHPTMDRLFDVADREGVTLFGTSAKFLESLRGAGVHPRDHHDLTSVRTITSTGSPLSPEGFQYVYEHIKPDVHLASISGGTDLCGCLVAGDPTGPVFPGEIQRPGLGMDIDVVDESGATLRPGEQGELVCRNAFVSMPLGFWSDPDDERYRRAYFETIPGAWHQGDFAEWTDHGGIVISGRSDATLNPGGVRIGTAEIYRQVELVPEVADSLVIGQDWDGDVRIVLFVVLGAGHRLDEELETRIRQQIRHGASPRHVPAKVVAVADLPRTRSGKLTELAVRAVVHGHEVRNVEALANPDALELFRDLPDLAR